MTVEATTRGTSPIDRERLAALTERELRKLAERTAQSKQRHARGLKVMPGGVPSSFQENDPWPVYLERGEGARVWDVDGHEYVDFHNGFGVMCIGHANPTVGAAVKARVDQGPPFAAPTDGSIVVAEELAARFGLPQWRFTNAGTESTMDAVHLARGATGRDTILKIEGSYHGHHDAVMVSVYPDLEDLGERDDPRSVVYGAGYPAALTELTRAVPFNDTEALEKVLAKATCGGYPGGSIGMTAELAEQISEGRVHQYGTFNGNPLVMAAAQATLTEVLTEAAYEKPESSNRWLLDACNAVIERYDLPCYTEGLGAKGCVVFSGEPLREYRDYLTKVDGELSTLAWLYHMNHGIFMTPGVEEEWTLSLAHSDEHIDRYVAAFEVFASDVSA